MPASSLSRLPHPPQPRRVFSDCRAPDSCQKKIRHARRTGKRSKRDTMCITSVHDRRLFLTDHRDTKTPYDKLISASKYSTRVVDPFLDMGMITHFGVRSRWAEPSPPTDEKRHIDVSNKMTVILSSDCMETLRENYKQDTHWGVLAGKMKNGANYAHYQDIAGLKDRTTRASTPLGSGEDNSDRGLKHSVLRDALLPRAVRLQINEREAVIKDEESENAPARPPLTKNARKGVFPGGSNDGSCDDKSEEHEESDMARIRAARLHPEPLPVDAPTECSPQNFIRSCQKVSASQNQLKLALFSNRTLSPRPSSFAVTHTELFFPVAKPSHHRRSTMSTAFARVDLHPSASETTSGQPGKLVGPVGATVAGHDAEMIARWSVAASILPRHPPTRHPHPSTQTQSPTSTCAVSPIRPPHKPLRTLRPLAYTTSFVVF
ncbi:hypothetical protein FB45DRAFT_1004271 [Roridomyces roridus]|uniref:Uncharacterized protein n=1 Tax=Roridomyces roridus TaxID=1738132 RepID=A0AAD7FMX2_9AGAR|nr:hypothetical protein FB45DRAFT_1004271 [Roridomyces roridus]